MTKMTNLRLKSLVVALLPLLLTAFSATAQGQVQAPAQTQAQSPTQAQEREWLSYRKLVDDRRLDSDIDFLIVIREELTDTDVPLLQAVHLEIHNLQCYPAQHLEGSYKGHTGAFDLRFTNVFVHRDGRWQIVRHQAAQIQKH